MIDRCPICQVRLKKTSICPRCSVDLTVPLQLARQAENLQKHAITLLLEGDLSAAKQELEQAIYLRKTSLAQALLEFIQQLEKNKNAPEQNRTNRGRLPQVILLGYEH